MVPYIFVVQIIKKYLVIFFCYTKNIYLYINIQYKYLFDNVIYKIMFTLIYIENYGIFLSIQYIKFTYLHDGDATKEIFILYNFMIYIYIYIVLV